MPSASHPAPADSSARRPRRARPPALEVLEDRCLPSAVTTTVPAFSQMLPLVSLADITMVAQPRTGANVVFLGDSIGFELAYGTGTPVWGAFFVPLGAANYAVVGQTTQSLLYQLSLGQLNGLNPAVVVLDIGGNNLLQGNTPQDTAAGVLADVAAIHQALPQAQVLVLGVLPGGANSTDSYRVAGAQTDAFARAELAGDPQATFVDLGSLFVRPDGTISTTMLWDYLHPTTLGYLQFAEALMPYLQQAGVGNAPPPGPGRSLLSG